MPFLPSDRGFVSSSLPGARPIIFPDVRGLIFFTHTFAFADSWKQILLPEDTRVRNLTTPQKYERFLLNLPVNIIRISNLHLILSFAIFPFPLSPIHSSYPSLFPSMPVCNSIPAWISAAVDKAEASPSRRDLVASPPRTTFFLPQFRYLRRPSNAVWTVNNSITRQCIQSIPGYWYLIRLVRKAAFVCKYDCQLFTSASPPRKHRRTRAHFRSLSIFCTEPATSFKLTVAATFSPRPSLHSPKHTNHQRDSRRNLHGKPATPSAFK